jgi:acyl-CoA synthetase (AMP-forming)/AMP-acid ligase II
MLQTYFRKPLGLAERPAIKYGTQSYTYSELEDRVRRLAAGLSGQGLGHGDRIVVWMDNRPQLVETIFAGLTAGCAVVPVNPRLHQMEVAYILRDCQPGAFVLDETHEFDAVVAPGIQRFRSDDLPYADAGQSCADLSPSDPAWLFYTSGTTGRPKGAMLTHRSLMAMTMNCLADVYSFQPEDVVLHAAPLAHGSGLYMLPSLARGTENVILKSRFEPSMVFKTIEQERVTAIAFLAPTQIVKLISDATVKAHDLSSLRTVIYGGGPMYVEHMKEALTLLGQIWVQIYGQGETPMTGTYLRSRDHRTDSPEWERRLGSAGIGRTDIELRIRAADDKDVTSGDIGEIVLQGDAVMKGYWNNPEATAEALRDGWLHTGDLAYSDADGYIYLVDRLKDLIISGSNNIYAREVEEALLTHPDVREVAVIGVPCVLQEAAIS